MTEWRGRFLLPDEKWESVINEIVPDDLHYLPHLGKSHWGNSEIAIQNPLRDARDMEEIASQACP
jgi:hypothetical protein